MTIRLAASKYIKTCPTLRVSKLGLALNELTIATNSEKNNLKDTGVFNERYSHTWMIESTMKYSSCFVYQTSPNLRTHAYD